MKEPLTQWYTIGKTGIGIYQSNYELELSDLNWSNVAVFGAISNSPSFRMNLVTFHVEDGDEPIFYHRVIGEIQPTLGKQELTETKSKQIDVYGIKRGNLHMVVEISEEGIIEVKSWISEGP